MKQLTSTLFYMNKLTVSTIFLFLTNLCFAQSIVDKYEEALGGKERIDNINTAIVKVEMVSSHIGRASSIAFLRKYYKFRIELSYEGGRSSIHCYDGAVHTGTNKATLSMIEALNKKPKKFFVFNEIIFVPKSDLKDEPDEVINGVNCNVVSYNDLEWKEFHKYYFDKETHLLIAEDSSGYPIFYENYQSTEGILFPMRMKHTVEIMDTITEYTEIILNPDLPDDIFDCNPE